MTLDTYCVSESGERQQVFFTRDEFKSRTEMTLTPSVILHNDNFIPKYKKNSDTEDADNVVFFPYENIKKKKENIVPYRQENDKGIVVTAACSNTNVE